MAQKPSVYVNIEKSVSVEKALRKFKRMCESHGIVREYKKRQYFVKPSMENKEKKEAAEKRRIKNAIKMRRSGGKI